MAKDDVNVNHDGKVSVSLPLTSTTGKVRIKTRGSIAEYGWPLAPRQTPLTEDAYVEWQIGYDLLANDENSTKTSLADRTFENYKGETKFAYELSEIIYYAHKVGLISDHDLTEAYKFIEHLPRPELIDELDYMLPFRADPEKVEVHGVAFERMNLTYRLLVRELAPGGPFAEVLKRELQRGVGLQPMLYLCLPLPCLKFRQDPIGRVLDPKERAVWLIEKPEAKMALDLFKTLGMLSPKHQHDALAILRTLFAL